MGDTVAVGAPGESSVAVGVNGAQDNGAVASGAVYVFTVRSGVWTQQAYIKATNTDPGDGFGTSVALGLDTLVVGAPYESSLAIPSRNDAESSGAAYLYGRNGSWAAPVAPLKAGNAGAGDFFGASVALWGTTLVVGAPGESSRATGVNGDGLDNAFAGAGAVYVFGPTLAQEAYIKAGNTGAGDRFGQSVAVSDGILVVGAADEDGASVGVLGPSSGADNNAPGAGAAYVYVGWGSPRSWTPRAYVKAPNAQADDGLGWAVAVSGRTVVVGAPYESSADTGVDGNQADNSASMAGATYVLE
jgi:hypothetical protein